MRGPALLMVLLFIATPAAAMMTEALDDDIGDVQVSAQGSGPQPTGGTRFAPLDLQDLTVEEHEDHFTFVLSVADLDPPGEAFIVEDSTWRIHFTHEDQNYRLRMYRAIADQLYFWGWLERYDPRNNFFSFVRQTDVSADLGDDTLSVEVLRSDIVDSRGAEPYPGREIKNFWAESHLRTNEGGMINLGVVAAGQQWDASDRMPDTGMGAAIHQVEIGLENSGHAELWAKAPMRASNGEEATFVYTILAKNNRGEADAFSLEAIGAPSNWNVVLLDPFVELAPGETRELPVLVSVPFQHQHGTVQTFQVHMTSQSDPSAVGRVELGIRYHAVPQPAGHHDTLYLHSARFGQDTTGFVVTDNLFSGNSGQPWMNTLESDENDEGVPIKGIYQGYGTHPEGNGQPISKYSWFVFLSPDLEMGMDWDMDRTGYVKLPFTSPQSPIQDATVDIEFWHWGYDQDGQNWQLTIPADPAPQQLTLSPGETRELEFEVTPLVDELPYNKRAALGLIINMTMLQPHLFTGAEAPELAPGGHMQLPLNEYRDPIAELFAGLDKIDLHIMDAHQKVNPGEVRLVEAMLTNHLDEAVQYDLGLQGINAAWASLPNGTSIVLGAHETTTIPIAVLAPADADGLLADLVITAQAKHDPTVRALARFVVEADDSTDLQDDAALLDGFAVAEKESPGVGLVAIGAAVAGLMAIRRRR